MASLETPWPRWPPWHTSYLSRIPRIYPCKFFLAGVNFYRFNAKNWHFGQILREKVAFFFTDFTGKIGVFRLNFILQKICPCKKMTNIRYAEAYIEFYLNAYFSKKKSQVRHVWELDVRELSVIFRVRARQSKVDKSLDKLLSTN